MAPLVLPFPDVSPEIFSVELGGFTFALRWYALAYIVALGLAWLAVSRLVRSPSLWAAGRAPLTSAQAEDVMTWVVLGVILGGRLGYVLFYQPAYYLAHPLEILAVWQGGMSFHGGLLGVIAGVTIYCLRVGAPLLSAFDLGALATPPGLFLGRLANFVNAELWGEPSTLPWAVVFPGAAAQACSNVGELCARHPSQLYEAVLEGLLLGAVLWWLALRRGALRRPGLLGGLFLAGYGAARAFVELFRQADAQYIAPDNPAGHVLRLGEWGLTMGQILSLPMLAVGLAAMAWALRRPAGRRPRVAPRG
jgi:phosphatidylglycerol:prolipoprotein diacylglycerol transferase